MAHTFDADRRHFPPTFKNDGATDSVVSVCSASELITYIDSWDDLSSNAVEPNIFYEPWFMVPAIEAFSAGKRNVEFVLVFTVNSVDESDARILSGFFPLERHSRYKGMPVSVFTLWKHLYCFLCTPLIRRGHERECLAYFFDWLAKESCALLEFGFINWDGPLRQFLVDHCQQNLRFTCLTESFPRALLRNSGNFEGNGLNRLSIKHRNQLVRTERHLAEKGRLEYTTLAPGEDVRGWLEEFLQLEASGWKGVEGSAMACNKFDREWFIAAALEAFRRGRLLLQSARLDGQAVAFSCHFLAMPGAFTFKIAFDERYEKFSPGVLLEIENIRQFHARADLQWIDSCTATDNPTYNRLWADRRIIADFLVSTGRGFGNLTVVLISFLRLVKRKISLLKKYVFNRICETKMDN